MNRPRPLSLAPISVAVLCAAVCAVLIPSTRASAQVYSITWNTVDCGGGTSQGTAPVSGSIFSLSATIGQHDAGAALVGASPAGSTFSLTGGFWAQSGTVITPPTCPPDFNHDGALDPDDLADYITAFFSIPPTAGSDFNADGVTDPDDLADYITAFFTGCG